MPSFNAYQGGPLEKEFVNCTHVNVSLLKPGS